MFQAFADLPLVAHTVVLDFFGIRDGLQPLRMIDPSKVLVSELGMPGMPRAASLWPPQRKTRSTGRARTAHGGKRTSAPSGGASRVGGEPDVEGDDQDAEIEADMVGLDDASGDEGGMDFMNALAEILEEAMAEPADEQEAGPFASAEEGPGDMGAEPNTSVAPSDVAPMAGAGASSSSSAGHGASVADAGAPETVEGAEGLGQARAAKDVVGKRRLGDNKEDSARAVKRLRLACAARQVVAICVAKCAIAGATTYQGAPFACQRHVRGACVPWQTGLVGRNCVSAILGTCFRRAAQFQTRWAVSCPRAGENQRKARRQHILPQPTMLASRVAPENVMVIPGGTITFYEKGNYFVAECEVHGKSCKRTRTATASKMQKHSAQGRPLGFLAGFLMKCSASGSIEEHYKSASKLSHTERVAARAEFGQILGSARLLSMERPQMPGEGPEPELCL